MKLSLIQIRILNIFLIFNRNNSIEFNKDSFEFLEKNFDDEILDRFNIYLENDLIILKNQSNEIYQFKIISDLEIKELSSNMILSKEKNDNIYISYHLELKRISKSYEDDIIDDNDFKEINFEEKYDFLSLLSNDNNQN